MKIKAFNSSHHLFQPFHFNHDSSFLFEPPRRIGFSKKPLSRSQSVKRSCSLNFDDKLWCQHGDDFLDPVVLGIRPELPDWPSQEDVAIEQKAKSFNIPLSLRMIRKKLQQRESMCRADYVHCAVKAALASTIFIVVELQRYASHERDETFSRDDLDKAQRETHLSFVRLFQQVFSQSPAFMLDVMILLVNFTLHSSSSYFVRPQEEEQTDEASNPEGDQNNVIIVDPNATPRRLARDDCELYVKTDLEYQMSISQEPNNSLLLCNYAQFLFLVNEDHDRAEEYFQRAIEASPNDAESMNKYAKFLHVARKDFLGAEEMYLQALAEEPGCSHYYSTYAGYLWSMGADDTCFPWDAMDHPFGQKL